MSSNIHWQNSTLSKSQRAERNNQRPVLLWITGLSGSGKSTLANALEKALFDRGHHTYLLDGDNLRHGLCQDLGFSEHDRIENIRRAGSVATLMVDAGLIVIASFISPFQRERQMIRKMLAPDEYIEVYLNTPIEVCEERDSKGLYQKARKGMIQNFTGIDSAYEAPDMPDIMLDSSSLSVEESVNRLIGLMQDKELI